MGKLLELKKINAFYGGLQALHNVDVYLEGGEIVALMGPNGAGKSTVLKTIFGLLPAASGSIIWRGNSIKPISYEMAERGIAFVPQGRRIFSHLTIAENLEIGGYIIKDKDILRERMTEVLEIFPALQGRLKAKSGTLSGGQQQMVALARGLMTNPEVLLLDEPSLGLAPKIVKEVFDTIKRINETRGTAIVVVEHNIKSLLEIVNRAYVLDKGRVVAEGIPRDLIGDNVLEKVFLGKFEHNR